MISRLIICCFLRFWDTTGWAPWNYSSTLSFISMLDGGGWQSHASAALPPGKRPLYRRLGGAQGRTGLVRKISQPPGFDPQTVQSVASCYTDLAFPAIVPYPMSIFIRQVSLQCFMLVLPELLLSCGSFLSFNVSYFLEKTGSDCLGSQESRLIRWVCSEFYRISQNKYIAKKVKYEHLCW
jgi:hypothetical protein